MAFYGVVEGDGMVQVPPADVLLVQQEKSWKKARYYPSQLAKSLLKDQF